MMMEALDLNFLTKRVNQEQKAHPCGNPEISATTQGVVISITAPFNSPIRLMGKTNGSWRMRGDYHNLN